MINKSLYSRRNSSVSLSSFAVSLAADFCLLVAAATEEHKTLHAMSSPYVSLHHND